MQRADGESVLSEAVGAYQAALGARLVAAYALGSLAHGGFAPLVSDVDLGLILADPVEPGDAGTIRTVADAQKRTGSALAERLSVFWGTAATLRGQSDGGRFPPLDRLDLVEHGRLLAGVDVRAAVPRPSGEELLVSGAEFALELLAGERAGGSALGGDLGSLHAPGSQTLAEIREPERLLARGVRWATKLVLFPVRFMFTAATGHVATNQDAAAWYLAREAAPAAELVVAAITWREAPPRDDGAAAHLLRGQLVALYRQYIDDQVTRLEAAGRPELARSFSRWRGQLERHD
ncbi:MAG TPA: hypothetical protein VMU39_19670 [Solirubrobacteraceae bacterium]|nr:hypothetical protein [Solirubrobacteraceae bacterium]